MTEAEPGIKNARGWFDLFLDIIFWILTIIGPWLLLIVTHQPVWAPEWFKGVTVVCLVGHLLFGIGLYKLLKKWAGKNNSKAHRVFRIIAGILLYLSLGLTVLGDAVVKPPYDPILNSYAFDLPSGKRTFYISKTYSGWFETGNRVWVRMGNSPFVLRTEGFATKCELYGDPEIKGDTVRIYFKDEHIIFYHPDQVFEYNAATGESTWSAISQYSMP
ncbi:MAG TPA: hypothetical protein VL651_10850 [Bacteroidia bacterium]|jgi:hypothetical protein|nr:hypothetical protein [Bacteroidia bacterium]